jgi:hypothetical protein
MSLSDAFTCISSMGQNGCGFEHTLEAAYQALSDTTILENQGFLRPDAVLAVVFDTDEDDCSAPPTSNLFSIAMTSVYGPVASYRCTNYGIACDAPGGGKMLAPYGDSGGPLNGCVPATAADGGKLIDVQQYIDYFTKPAAMGGVKADPRDVILFAWDAPTTPFATTTGDPNTGAPCPAGVPVGMPNCQVYLEHSCNASPAFFGDPAVRLSTVVNSITHHREFSICDSGDTTGAAELEALIFSAVSGTCPTS